MASLARNGRLIAYVAIPPISRRRQISGLRSQRKKIRKSKRPVNVFINLFEYELRLGLLTVPDNFCEHDQGYYHGARNGTPLNITSSDSGSLVRVPLS